MNFPPFNTNQFSSGKSFDLNDPVQRYEYFQAKAGHQIELLKAYLDTNTFLGFFLAKKGAGKGTYSKLITELLGAERFAHISVGDIVRDAHAELDNPSSKAALVEYLTKNYRGYISIDEALDALKNKTQQKLVPTELILALVLREVQKHGRKGIFLDGLPRNLDQISYSLYFRALINFRDDPDFFIIIDVPEQVLDERIKTRRVCPLCKTSRNTKLLPTKFVSFEPSTATYQLICDNSECTGYQSQVMVEKQGDSDGIESIRDRLISDGKLMTMADGLFGIPKIRLRNSVAVTEVKNYCEDYELTREYYYEHDAAGTVTTLSRPWVIKDDEGVDCNSLLAGTVVVSLLHQLCTILDLK